MKMYLVTADGTLEYGSEMYAIGIYKTKEQAEQVKQEVLEQIAANAKANNKVPHWISAEKWCSDCVHVVELEINKTYPLVYHEEWKTELCNDKYVGGYSE